MDVMVQSDLLQLRVLAGLHEGAVVPLSDKPTTWQLARDPDADVLLRDAPGQAQLSRQADAWIWRDAEFEQVLQPGQVWRWGPLVLALAFADQPWPDAWPELVFDRQPAPLGDPVAEMSKASVDDALPPETPQAELVSPEAGLNAQPPAKAVVVRRRAMGLLQQLAKRPVMLIAVAALALAFIMVLLVSLILGQRTVQPTAAAVPKAVSPTVDLDRIKRFMAGMGLLESVEVKVRQDGRLLIRGVVADNEQLESLIAAVSRQARRYTPQLLTQSEFESRALALAKNLPEGIVALTEPDGLLVLQARRDEVDWPLARQLVEVDLPEVVAVEYRPRAKGELLQPLVQLDGNALPSTSSRLVMPSLPAFAVVVGGARPYVVLADGRKWQPGGKINGLLLVSIDDQNIVFEDARGNSFNKPR